MESGTNRKAVRTGAAVSCAEPMCKIDRIPALATPSPSKTRVLPAASAKYTAFRVHWPGSLSLGKVTAMELDTDLEGANLMEPPCRTPPEGLMKLSST